MAHEESAFQQLTQTKFYENTSCHMCNGFYGPNFDEFICSTCHLFLFPKDINQPGEVTVLVNKKDDSDSGNDEPTEMYYERRRSSSRHRPAAQVLPLPSEENRNGQCRSNPLAERLNQLCVPDTVTNFPEGILDKMPPEVLLLVFSYLDDLSLWMVSQVCKRWNILLKTHFSNEQWERFTRARWPLFRPFYKAANWFAIYTKLMESTPCKQCLNQTVAQLQPFIKENSWRKNRVQNELKTLQNDPPEGIEAVPLDADYSRWMASMTGPTDSPYEGGVFYLYIQVPASYPMRPPLVRFITRIFHPNVSRHGDIGIDSIQHNWSLALTISKILVSIQSLLTDPYCQVCMEPEAGNMYLHNREMFNIIARNCTWAFAMHDALVM